MAITAFIAIIIRSNVYAVFTPETCVPFENFLNAAVVQRLVFLRREKASENGLYAHDAEELRGGRRAPHHPRRPITRPRLREAGDDAATPEKTVF